MRNIDQFIGDNIGGLESFLFIPVDDAISIARPVNHIIQEAVVINVAGGAQWFTAYITQGTLFYKEDKNKTVHGNPYNRSLVGFVPKDTEELAELFDEMGDVRFLIDCLDNNGKRKLVGSLDSPLVFASLMSSGEAPEGRNGHQLTFSGNASHKAYFYDPDEGSASASGS